MTETDFRNNELHRTALAQVLESPALKMAIEIIQDTIRPRLIPSGRPHLHVDTMIAHHYHTLYGKQRVLDMLKRMTLPNPVNPESEDEEEEFFHALSSEIKQAITQNRPSHA